MLILAENFYEETLQFIDKKKIKTVCLTPMACAKMDAFGLYYTIPEKYLVWKEDSNYKELIEITTWLVDSLFVEDMGTFCLTMLKNLLDPFVEKVSVFKRIYEDENYNTTLFLRYRYDDTIDYDLYFKGESIYSRIYRHWPSIGKNDLVVDIPYKIKKHYKDNRYLRLMNSILNKFMILNFNCSMKNHVVCLANVSMKKEFKAFNKENIPVVFLPDFSRYPVQSLDSKVPSKIVVNIAEYLNVDKYFVGKVLGKRLLYFTNVIIPTILDIVRYYKRFFMEKNVKYLVFDRRNKIHQHAALLAAQQLRIPTIYVRHGWDAYNFPERTTIRMNPFNYYITVDDIEKSKIFEKNFKNCAII